jgi:hypothetical protein
MKFKQTLINQDWTKRSGCALIVDDISFIFDKFFAYQQIELVPESQPTVVGPWCMPSKGVGSP